MQSGLDDSTSFIHFAAQVLDHLGISRPEMQVSEGDAQEVSLVVDRVRISLSHEPELNPGRFLIDARLGCLEPLEGAAQRLLVENADLLEHGWLTLGAHEGTDEISYLALLETAIAQADGVADCLRALARRAALRVAGPQWKPPSAPTKEDAPRRAVMLSDCDRRVDFAAWVRALCDDLGAQTERRETLASAASRVTISTDAGRVHITHRSRTDAFCTARGVSGALSTDVAERVARRLLQMNAELANEGIAAFAFTPDFRHVIWRVTCLLPGTPTDEFVARVRWAAEMANYADTDRPAVPGMLHMLA